MADENKTRMGGNQKGGLLKKTLGDSGLPKAANSPSFKEIGQKGIMSKGGSLGAGTAPKRQSLNGFSKGGTVKP